MATEALTPDIAVISLPRSVERLMALRQRLGAADPGFTVIKGVDGLQLDPQDLRSRGLLETSALSWPRGQLGCALSHLRCLLRCLRKNQPLMILEDDALLAPDWRTRLQPLLLEAPRDWDLLLLGWNLDSCLQLEWSEGITLSALCQPRLPPAAQLQAALASPGSHRWYRLHKALGLAGYVVSPAGAARILSWALPLRTLPITVPELPERDCFSFDGQLNSLYPKLSTWVCVPPLVLGANDKQASLTAT